MLPKLHPACAASPKLSDADSQALTEDIRLRGQIYDIWLMPDGRLLDGRERYIACERLGIQPRCKTYEGDDPIGFVVAAQTMRKNVTKQALIRAIAALETLSPGGVPGTTSPRNNSSRNIPTAQEIADVAGSSEATMHRARVVNKRAAPNVLAMVDAEEVTISAAHDALADNPSHEEQATWTRDTVKQHARARRERGEGQPRGRKPAAEKPSRQPRIRYGEVKFPTWEETGYPVNGTLEEQQAHVRRYGRTPLHPQQVTHLLEHRKGINFFVGHIAFVAADTHPNAAQFFEQLDALLAWKPQPDPDGKGYGIKFANDGKAALARLDTVLDTAITRLTELREAYDAWKAEREPDVEAVAHGNGLAASPL
jgi:hypothetical protein